jgi:hypothetical protein
MENDVKKEKINEHVRAYNHEFDRFDRRLKICACPVIFVIMMAAIAFHQEFILCFLAIPLAWCISKRRKLWKINVEIHHECEVSS